MSGNEQMSSQQEVGIFTDCLSNLQTIKKGVAETAEEEVLLRTLAQHQVKLTFHHVRWHQDNHKNIEVDRLCDISIEHPDRLNSDDQGGKKTSAKIKTSAHKTAGISNSFLKSEKTIKSENKNKNKKREIRRHKDIWN